MIWFETASAGLESKAIIIARSANLSFFENYYTDYFTIIAIICTITHIIPKLKIVIQVNFHCWNEPNQQEQELLKFKHPPHRQKRLLHDTPTAGPAVALGLIVVPDVWKPSSTRGRTKLITHGINSEGDS